MNTFARRIASVLAGIMSMFMITTASANEVFGPPIDAPWLKIVDSPVLEQWTKFLEVAGFLTRFDIVMAQDAPVGYIVRMQCPDGSVSVSVFAADKVLGIGQNCQGQLFLDPNLPLLLERVGELPPEVAAVIP